MLEFRASDNPARNILDNLHVVPIVFLLIFLRIIARQVLIL